MAAGAMVSLSFAVSPPITLLPPRPVPIDASGNVPSQQQRTSETMGAASADTFERRWQAATDDIPPMLVRDPLEGLIGGLPTLPLAQDAPRLAQIEPSRDLLEGLIGGLPMLPLAKRCAASDAGRTAQSRRRTAARASGVGHGGAAGAASAAIRRLRPTWPASGRLQTKPSPLLALHRSVIIYLSGRPWCRHIA